MKNFTLKKLAIVAIAMFTMCITANSQQKGDKSAGGNLIYGTAGSGTVSNYGIGGRFLYNATDPIRIDGTFQYFLKKEGVSMFTLGVNGHYLYPVQPEITVYPLVGLGVMNMKGEGESISKLCLTIGGGFDFKLTDKVSLNCEPKYWICEIEGESMYRFMLSVGLIFKLQ